MASSAESGRDVARSKPELVDQELRFRADTGGESTLQVITIPSDSGRFTLHGSESFLNGGTESSLPSAVRFATNACYIHRNFRHHHHPSTRSARIAERIAMRSLWRRYVNCRTDARDAKPFRVIFETSQHKLCRYAVELHFRIHRRHILSVRKFDVPRRVLENQIKRGTSVSSWAMRAETIEESTPPLK